MSRLHLIAFAFAIAFVLGGAACSGATTSDDPARVTPASDADAGDAGSLPAPDASVPDASSTITPFATAPHLAWPSIPSHGGHLLDPLRVVTVIAEDEPFAADLTSFGDSIGTSAWFAAFATEYGLTGAPSHVVVKGAHVDGGTSFTQAQMNAYIAASVAAASPAPVPDGRTVYVLYLPPQTTMVVGGAPDTACAGVPYHTEYGTLGDGMAVLNRCQGSFPSQLEMFTIVAAHEIAEAATDANPARNPAWLLRTDDVHAPWMSSVWNEVEAANLAEVGDLCIFTRVIEKGFSFQRTFSNVAAQRGGDPCVPALPIPFFGVTPDPKTRGWFAVQAGTTVDVALVGWSTAVTGDWVVWSDKGKGAGGTTMTTRLSSGSRQSFGNNTLPTTNNGRSFTLAIDVPGGVSSGWWGVVELWSWHAQQNGAYVDGEDLGHESVIGVWVP